MRIYASFSPLSIFSGRATLRPHSFPLPPRTVLHFCPLAPLPSDGASSLPPVGAAPVRRRIPHRYRPSAPLPRVDILCTATTLLVPLPRVGVSFTASVYWGYWSVWVCTARFVNPCHPQTLSPPTSAFVKVLPLSRPSAPPAHTSAT
ncbi:hypothetical protein B0H14DRAFT_3450499 [Mycena olivaceomarginata]|nr:hypothetical protein B0H14DRAFT_3450499 [Mycena olivaceomarginata]